MLLAVGNRTEFIREARARGWAVLSNKSTLEGQAKWQSSRRRRSRKLRCFFPGSSATTACYSRTRIHVSTSMIDWVTRLKEQQR